MYWYQQAIDVCEYPPAIARLGYHLLTKVGDIGSGMMLLCKAASLGSMFANLVFGRIYFYCEYGKSDNNSDGIARHWNAIINGVCTYKDMNKKVDTSVKVSWMDELPRLLELKRIEVQSRKSELW